MTTAAHQPPHDLLHGHLPGATSPVECLGQVFPND